MGGARAVCPALARALPREHFAECSAASSRDWASPRRVSRSLKLAAEGAPGRGHLEAAPGVGPELPRKPSAGRGLATPAEGASLGALRSAEEARELGDELLAAGDPQASGVYCRGLEHAHLLLDAEDVDPELMQRAEAVGLLLYLGLAQSCLERCDWQSAMESASVVLHVDPDNSKALYLRGVAAVHLDSAGCGGSGCAGLDQACEDVERVVQTDPGNRLAHEKLRAHARAQRAGGDLREPQPRTSALDDSGGKVTLAYVGSPARMRPATAQAADTLEPGSDAYNALCGAWRRAVEDLRPLRAWDGVGGLRSECPVDVWDLERLRELLEHDAAPRCEVVQDGDQQVLLTAPHCICLRRDGEQPHLPEDLTGSIVRSMSQELRGASLSWTAMEQRRVALLWALDKRRTTAPGQLLDPRNRDPNYLATAELEGNAWFGQMLAIADLWRLGHGPERPLLHIDVHGCRNPPESPAHLTVGLGAMCLKAHEAGGEALDRVRAFGAALEAELGAALADLRLKPHGDLVRVVVVPKQASTHARFSGAWAACEGRQTCSQQAVTFAGFSQSLQLEMSKALRLSLSRNKGYKATLPRLCSGLMAAWARVLHADAPEPVEAAA